MSLRRNRPDMWRLLWRVAFHEFVRIPWDEIPSGMSWLKHYDYVESKYHSLRSWTIVMTDKGKKQL